MNRCVSYVRVSTEDQNLGPEAQRRDIAAWCQSNGYEVAETFEDRLSGATLPEDSPALMTAFSYCEEHDIKVLIVSKRDRLARDKMRVALIEKYLSKHGIRILSASGEGNGDGPEDFLIRSIMDIFSEYERLVIAMRTKKALAVRKSQGAKLGGSVPYGFDRVDNGRRKRLADGSESVLYDLVPNAEEQQVIVAAAGLRAQGKRFVEICAMLNGTGVTTKQGRQWNAGNLRATLLRHGT